VVIVVEIPGHPGQDRPTAPSAVDTTAINLPLDLLSAD
jgi:hypothetical protein